MKKFFALLLTISMIVSMAFTAFADEDSNDSNIYPAEGTDSDILENRDFTAYQIFKADSINDAGELGNINWGDAISEEQQAVLLAWVNENLIEEDADSAETAADVAAALSKNEDMAKAFAKEVYGLVVENGDGEAVVSGETTLDIGYYLIVDVTEDPLTPDVRNLSILKVSDSVNPVVVVSKVSVPEVKKNILENGNPVNINEASIGDDIPYQVVGTLPSNLADYDTYFYQFTDSFSKGLTYNENLKVFINDNKVETGFNAEFDAEKNVLTVTFEDIKSLKVTKDSEVVLTYSAKLNKDAEIAVKGNPNEVDLTYSNSPDQSSGGKNDPKGTTPKSVVTTFTTELTITKTDKDGNWLPGVEFTLTGDGVNVVLVKENSFAVSAEGTYFKLLDGTYTEEAPTDVTSSKYESTETKYAIKTTVTDKDSKEENVKVTGTVGEDGTITFTGLGAGKYKLEETVTLPGYNTIAPIEFEITAEVSEDGKSIVFGSTNKDITLNDTNALATTIVNKKGVVLPETGGMGTTVFYIVGVALVLGAGILLVVKKRMNNN